MTLSQVRAPFGRQFRRDLALLGPIAAFSCVGVWFELRYATLPVPWQPGAYLLTVAAAVALLPRRRYPVASAAACLAFVGGFHWAGYEGFAPAVLVCVACYALAAYGGRPGPGWSGLGYGLLGAGYAWLVLALPPHPLTWYAVYVTVPTVTYVAGAVLGASDRRRRADHEARVRQEAVTAEERLGRRLAEERLRIARELHDVLAHTISVVAVQSNAALDALPADPEQAREALLLVRGAAKQAMPELRAAVDLLRGGGTFETPPPGTSRAGTRPQPTLAQLPDLVAQARESGLNVELHTESDLGRAPSIVQLTVYRIVQEALTNVQRHSCARAAVITVSRSPQGVTTQIDDDGTGAAGRAPGFGLIGMRERAEALGGSFEAGNRQGGGFGIRVDLPWDDQSLETESHDSLSRKGRPGEAR